MIASEVTIVDDGFGFVMTKFNKNVQEFMENYCYRMGKEIEFLDEGFVANLHSQKDENLTHPLGTIRVIY